MNNANTGPLLLVGKVLTIFMQVVMGIAGFAILIAVPALLFFGGDIAAEAASEFPDAAETFPSFALYGVLLVAFAVIAAVFVFFHKLRQMIDTVGAGDPFAPENATRLNHMAWLLLGVQILMVPAMGLALVIAKWADEVENADFTVDAGLDLTGILMVVVLFILALIIGAILIATAPSEEEEASLLPPQDASRLYLATQHPATPSQAGMTRS